MKPNEDGRYKIKSGRNKSQIIFRMPKTFAERVGIKEGQYYELWTSSYDNRKIIIQKIEEKGK